ncbi:protein of unknown function [Lactiplantibacillus plantarum]
MLLSAPIEVSLPVTDIIVKLGVIIHEKKNMDQQYWYCSPRIILNWLR